MDNIISYIESNDINEILINIILVYHDARKACLYYDIVLNEDLIKLIDDLDLYIIDDEKSFFITKDKDLVLPRNDQETGRLLGYINSDDVNWNNHRVNRYAYKIRFINKDGCSYNFYTEVGSSLKKDEIRSKYNEFADILKKYNIEIFYYIEMINRNVIDLRDIMSYDNISDYNFLTGLLSGVIIISSVIIISYTINRTK